MCFIKTSTTKMKNLKYKKVYKPTTWWQPQSIGPLFIPRIAKWPALSLFCAVPLNAAAAAKCNFLSFSHFQTAARQRHEEGDMTRGESSFAPNEGERKVGGENALCSVPLFSEATTVCLKPFLKRKEKLFWFPLCRYIAAEKKLSTPETHHGRKENRD